MVDSVLHGASSFLGSLVPMIPFLIGYTNISIYISIVLSLLALAALGLFSGRISGQGYLKSILRMVLLGALVVIACSVLQLSP